MSIVLLNAFGSTTVADVKDVLDAVVVDLVDEVVVLVAVIDVVVEVLIFFISSISSSLGISDDELFMISNALFIELSIKLSVNVLLKVEFLVFSSLALKVFVVARVVAVSKIGSKVDNGFNAFSGKNSSSGSTISVLVIVIGLTDNVLVNADGVVVDIKDVGTLETG